MIESMGLKNSGVSNNYVLYAQRLRIALEKLGFSHICIISYLGRVDCGRDFRLRKDDSDFLH